MTSSHRSAIRLSATLLAVTPIVVMLLLLSLLHSVDNSDASTTDDRRPFLDSQWREQVLQKIVTPELIRSADSVDTVAQIVKVDLRLKGLLSDEQKRAYCEHTLLKHWNQGQLQQDGRSNGDKLEKLHNLVVSILSLRCSDDWKSDMGIVTRTLDVVFASPEQLSAEQVYHVSRILSLLRRDLKDYVQDNAKVLSLSPCSLCKLPFHYVNADSYSHIQTQSNSTSRHSLIAPQHLPTRSPVLEILGTPTSLSYCSSRSCLLNTTAPQQTPLSRCIVLHRSSATGISIYCCQMRR